MSTAATLLGRRHGLALDALVVAAPILCGLAFSEDLGFLTRIVIMSMFVMSLDLALGFAGIATLGQAALFGSGAYAAGIFAIHVSGDPLLGLAAGALAGTAMALVSGLLILRTQGLTLVVLSIAIGQVVLEIANKARGITGGSDGLAGIVITPLLGRFEFDLWGITGYVYAVAVFLLTFFALKRLTLSPFGLCCRGIKHGRPRMVALGTPVYRRLVAMHAIGGLVAGMAGALLAQTTQIVGLDSLGFTLSAEAMLMLVLGGAGTLYGGLLGTTIYMMVHHVGSALWPAHWLFLIGAMVVAVVLFAPGGLIDLAARLRAIATPRPLP